MKLVTIIDYGSGNIKSVFNAFNLLSRKEENLKVLVSSNKSDISNSTHLVLPGVGSFKSCIDGLKRSNLIETISKKVIYKKNYEHVKYTLYPQSLCKTPKWTEEKSQNTKAILRGNYFVFMRFFSKNEKWFH